MAPHTPNTDSVARALRCLAYGLVAALFAWIVSLYYNPGEGFTYLIEFGELNHSRLLPEIRAVNHFEQAQSIGYDGQWYAQIAVHPRLTDPVLKGAVDLVHYRARRILFEWTAWVLGGGDPIRIMNAYALQNVACWFMLAVLLLRWFPPASWGNGFRWASVLFSFGLIFSLRGALPDGPCLLVVALGMALLESGHSWWSALVFGLSGLGKDTSILCGSALGPPASRTSRARIAYLCQAVLVALPLTIWVGCLRLLLGPGDTLGWSNFSFPGLEVARKILGTVSSLVAEKHPLASVPMFDGLVLAGLLAQFLFFVLRVRLKDPWWRLGASYAVLLLFLGKAVWEDYPSAASRVLLPMTLAFNVRVPRGGWWPALLVAGNLGILGSVDFIGSSLPDRLGACFVVEGPSQLRFNAKDNFGITATYGPGNWWGPESERMPGKRDWDTWRWTRGDATITIHNPQPFTVLAELTFGMATSDPRHAVVTMDGKIAWQAALKPAQDNLATLTGIELPPGDTPLQFRTDRPAVEGGNGDHRRFAFSVRDLKITLVGRR